MGEHRTAIGCYEKAVALFRSEAERFYFGESLVRLGDCHRDLGDLAGAREAWRRALTVFDDLGSPDADSVRDKLVEIDESS